jgi:hypothetical protein
MIFDKEAHQPNAIMSFSITMTNAFETAAAGIAKAAVDDAITKLAAKYGFAVAEATEFLLAGGVVVKPAIIPRNAMPWCREIRNDCCRAIVPNGGLYTQCIKSPLADGPWCKGCAKQVEANGTTKYGDVEARLATDLMEYKVGRQGTNPYSVYMKKHGYTRDQVEAAAAEYGLTVDPAQFEPKRRGRPQVAERVMAIPEAEPEPDARPEPVTVTVSATQVLQVEAEDEEAAPAEETDESGEEDEAEGDLTYQQVIAMSAAEIKTACSENDIDIKDAEGKAIKAGTLRTLLLAKLNLHA